MFPNFTQHYAKSNGIQIHYVIGGDGPPLLLLHGYPQTLFIWNQMVHKLAQHFTVIASDLRGYGKSDCPPSDPDHYNYSKREMARDQVELMKHLGFTEFYLAGHDRGGRVAHRLLLDHEECVRKWAVLDIAPTHEMYTSTDMEFAAAYYHWFFLIQPDGYPEKMIGQNPDFFLKSKFKYWGKDSVPLRKTAYNHYKDCFDQETIRASCEDYRASATIDLEHDEIDLNANRKISKSLLCLWGQHGFVGRKYDVVKEWQKWAKSVVGFGLPCGHYLPEESPEETADALIEFFSDNQL